MAEACETRDDDGDDDMAHPPLYIYVHTANIQLTPAVTDRVSQEAMRLMTTTLVLDLCLLSAVQSLPAYSCLLLDSPFLC